jgi:hypothetical protein
MASSPSSTEARLASLERQVKWWRLAAVGLVAALVLGSVTAFQQPGTTGKLEAASLTLRNSWGGSVTLSLRPSGDLEARFSRASGTAPQAWVGKAGLVVVKADGREVARLGEPTSQQLGR